MRSRAQTEIALQEAALELLERDGVLAGLNLSELAQQAQINRGLVYHYFGSRRDLLRSALRRDFSRRIREIRAVGRLPFRARWVQFFQTLVRQRRAIRLASLLHLDRDPGLRMMPIRNETQARLAEDQARGDLCADIDTGALHAALNSLSFGYALFRGRLAKELGRPVRELDEDVTQILARLLAGLEPAPGAASSTQSEEDQ